MTLVTCFNPPSSLSTFYNKYLEKLLSSEQSQYPNLSYSKDIPNIANISHMTKMTINTFAIAPIDYSNAVTTIFMLTLFETTLSGLKVLIALKIFRAYRFTPYTLISIIDVMTIIKSSLFQWS